MTSISVQEQLKQYMEDKKCSLNSIAKSTQYTAAVLSQWMNEKYPGDNKAVDKAILNFLSVEENRKQDEKYNAEIPFIEHVNFRVFNEVASICHQNCEIGLITGEPGEGKSTSGRKYAEMHPDTVYIEVHRAFTTKSLFREIYEILGGNLSKPTGIYDLIEELIARLKGSKRLIIIDQAEYLPERALDLVRTIHDSCIVNGKSTIGILLTGLPRLYENIKGYNNQFAQLYQRISWYKKLGVRKSITFTHGISQSDVVDFVQSVFPRANGECSKLGELSKFNPRVLVRLIERCHRICITNNIALSNEVIDEAAKSIIL